jgi:outer membrane receptor for ferrienterochelin and colicins
VRKITRIAFVISFRVEFRYIGQVFERFVMTFRLKSVMLLTTVLLGSVRLRAQDYSSNDLPGLDSLLNIKVNTAAKYSQGIGEAPASVTVVTAAEISQYGARTLDEVLIHVTGFFHSYDRNYSYIGVRGFGRPTDYNDRILVLLDGHTLNDNVYGSAYTGTDMPLNMASIERIEVVRGPGSALYGTGAMFAVINIITKPGARIDGTTIGLARGSFNTTQATLLSGGDLGEHSDFMISATGMTTPGHDLYYREFDSPATNNGIAAGLDWDRNLGVMASLTYRSFTVRGLVTSRDKGVPTGSFDTRFNDDRYHSLDERNFLEFQYDASIASNQHAILRAYYDRANYFGGYPYDVMSWDASTGIRLGTEAQYMWDMTSDNRLTIGGEFRNNPRADQRLWDLDTVYLNTNDIYNEFSIYAQDEFQVTRDLAVTLGIRRDELSAKWTSVTPRAAVVFHPGATTTLKVLFGSAFRSPTAYEATYNDPTIGFKVNPVLESEQMQTSEFIYEQRLGERLYFDASVYHYSMDNLIDESIDPADSLLEFKNISHVDANGFEGSIRGVTTSGFGGSISYSFQQPRNESIDALLTNNPSHIFRCDLLVPAFSVLQANLQLQYESGRITIAGPKTGDLFLANVNLNARWPGDHIRISLLILNALNSRYEFPGGIEHLQPTLEQDGRTVTFGLEYKF